MLTSPSADDLQFILEIVVLPALSSCPGLQQTRSYYSLKVPLARLSNEIQRVHRDGGQIVRVMPSALLNPLLSPRSSLPWWIEIYTDYPRCLYYFGPFESLVEAQAHQAGFAEDLHQEGAESLVVQIKQCQPPILTQEW
ncbi:DUF1816 domain-containing protein [Synechocystis sp. LKSZ1]|uniref:DUF1816 domain-containing protein n=1 Tax=Synechocystis sp. LKSZ1 TaxID=3144951 RepID=UPI00336C2C01